MKINKILIFLIISIYPFLIYAAPSKSNGALVSPDDFEGQMTISGKEGEFMYVELPENIYGRVQRSDLGDIRVFDSNGLLVPFELRKPLRKTYTPPAVLVPFFKWFPENENNLPNNTNIEIDAAGAVIKVSNSVNKAANTYSVLVDLSELVFKPVSLFLDMGEKNKNFNSPVTVQYSSDLNSWRIFDKKQNIIRYGNIASASRYNISIPSDNAPYIILKFNENTPPVIGIKAEFEPVSVSEKTNETIFSGKKSKDSMSIEYSTGGFFPVIGMNFILLESDIMKIVIKNKADEKSSWIYMEEGRIYNLKTDEKNNIRKNKSFEIKSSAPYWLLESKNELPFSSIPDMQIIWEPFTLVFLARGAAPWILAYGNSDYAPVLDSFLTEVKDQKLFPASFTGEEKYEPGKIKNISHDYQQWILWGVLIFAVLMLSVLAYIMAKSIGKSSK